MHKHASPRTICRPIALAGLLLFIAGCPPFGNMITKNDAGPVQPVPPLKDIVKYLNDNSNRIQSLRYEDVTVVATQGFQSLNLRARMEVQKPLNFRLSAELMGNEAVDLGSNDHEFWWWITDRAPGARRNAQAGVGEQLYCSYDDLRDGKARHWKIPLEPAWVIEVLGMGTYSVDRFKQVVNAETVELVEKTRMNGRDVRKVIVFQRRQRPFPNPTVSDYKLIDDATGKILCSAHISEIHQDRDKTNYAFLPSKIEIECPDMKATLAMNLKYVAVNPGIVNPNSARLQPNPGQPVHADTFVRRPQAGTISRNLADPVGGFQRVGAESR